MKKKIIFWVILILLIAGAALGYTYFYKDRDQAVKYRTAKVERGTLSAFVTANGTINPVITVLVGSQVSGTIQKLYADYNSRVKMGKSHNPRAARAQRWAKTSTNCVPPKDRMQRSTNKSARTSMTPAC